MADKPPIRAKDRDTIIRALRAGVVPRLGLQHIQVGRKREIEALVSDIDRVGDGGSTVRFIIGTYGAGKTFFLFLVRQIALQKKLAVMQADLGPDKRIHATGGQAQTLYSELVKSLATRAFPDGGALRSMIESFISDTADRAQRRPIVDAITARLAPLREMISGPALMRAASRSRKPRSVGSAANTRPRPKPERTLAFAPSLMTAASMTHFASGRASRGSPAMAAYSYALMRW